MRWTQLKFTTPEYCRILKICMRARSTVPWAPMSALTYWVPEYWCWEKMIKNKMRQYAVSYFFVFFIFGGKFRAACYRALTDNRRYFQHFFIELGIYFLLLHIWDETILFVCHSRHSLMVVLKGANACYLVGLGANRRDAKHIGCNLADLIALGSPPQ